MNLDDYYLIRKRGIHWFVSHEYAASSFHVPSQLTADTPCFASRAIAVEYANAIDDVKGPSDYGILFEEDLEELLELNRQKVIQKIRES